MAKGERTGGAGEPTSSSSGGRGAAVALALASDADRGAPTGTAAAGACDPSGSDSHTDDGSRASSGEGGVALEVGGGEVVDGRGRGRSLLSKCRCLTKKSWWQGFFDR